MREEDKEKKFRKQMEVLEKKLPRLFLFIWIFGFFAIVMQLFLK